MVGIGLPLGIVVGVTSGAGSGAERAAEHKEVGLAVGGGVLNTTSTPPED
jgi:hypothetical protein